MKKTTLITLLIVTINLGLLKAQTNQGNLLIGVSSTLSLNGTSIGTDLMNIGFSSIKRKSDAVDFIETDPMKVMSINLLPKIGYFIVDNFAIGLDLNVSYSKNAMIKNELTHTVYSAGPFVRYYIPTSKVLPFIELNGSSGAIYSKSVVAGNSSLEDTKYSKRVMSLGGGIGLATPLGERVTLDVLAGYNSLTIKDKDDVDNIRQVVGTLCFKIGFTILLGSN